MKLTHFTETNNTSELIEFLQTSPRLADKSALKVNSKLNYDTDNMVDGSIRLTEDSIAYFIYTTPHTGEEARAYDMVLVQQDHPEGYSTFIPHYRDDYVYTMAIAKALGL